ncbi:MAG: divergent polysaccharide deacetylase family protein [Paracoccaceae bacterium]
MRGFVSGVIWGSVVAAAGLGVVSQLTPIADRGRVAVVPEVSAKASDAVIAEAVPEPVATPDAVTEIASADDTLKIAPKAPEGETAAPNQPTAAANDTAQNDTAVTATSPKPATPETSGASTAAAPAATKPAAEATAPAVSNTKDPVEGASATPPIEASAAPPDALDAAPKAPAVPEDNVSAPALTAVIDAKPAPIDPARPSTPGDDTNPAPADLPPPPPLTPEEQALLETSDLAVPSVADKSAEPPLTAIPEPGADAAVSSDPALLDPAPTPVAPNAEGFAEVDPAIPAILEPEPGLQPDAPQPIDPMLPAPGFSDAVDGVTTDRLPRISDVPNALDPAEIEPAIVLPEDQPAVTRFARPFENPSAKPIFAVILIDTGGPNVDRTALAALPFPVTFAIDPAAADAATAAAIYRAAGQEVVMLATGIPQGATASDLEVTFQSHAATLPEAVAVFDLEEGGFQNDRPLASQVVPVVKGQGRGLVTWDKGLNAGDQVARREGVPSALIFRRLDAEGESAPTLRRYLDRAAFKAAQDGRVAVVGETRPETVAALLEWTVEGRASSVVLAPITAILTTP